MHLTFTSMKKSLAIVFTLALASMLVSCSNNVDLAIDNPTNEDIEVSIDSLVVEVPARDVVWVEMGKGEHKVTLANDSVVKYNFDQAMYMLNPSLTQYLMYEQFYGSEAYKSMYVSTIPNGKVTYLGMELEGNYSIVKELINPITWDYGPREALPEMVEIDSDDNYTALVKLTDPIELIDEMSRGEEGATEEAPVEGN
jgi:hypothetical protein